jgi:hypothetical protein
MNTGIQVSTITMRECARSDCNRIIRRTPHAEPLRYEIIDPAVILERSDTKEIRRNRAVAVRERSYLRRRTLRSQRAHLAKREPHPPTRIALPHPFTAHSLPAV